MQAHGFVDQRADVERDGNPTTHRRAAVRDAGKRGALAIEGRFDEQVVTSCAVTGYTTNCPLSVTVRSTFAVVLRPAG